MIPKIIHYCWFGHNPLPRFARQCIASWRKFLPEYEIKEWNEDNFDVNIIPYTAEAYQVRKYAFVSDYARFWIIYHYGGLYFDTDVEIIKQLDDIIARGPFLGCEKDAGTSEFFGVAPGLGLGAPSGHELYKTMLDKYNDRHFIFSDGSYNQVTVVRYMTDLLMSQGLRIIPEIQEVCGITIYPKEYFCPKNYQTGEMNITSNTVAIHHYGATWVPIEQQIERKLWRFLHIKRHPLITFHIDRMLNRLGIVR